MNVICQQCGKPLLLIGTRSNGKKIWEHADGVTYRHIIVPKEVPDDDRITTDAKSVINFDNPEPER